MLWDIKQSEDCRVRSSVTRFFVSQFFSIFVTCTFLGVLTLKVFSILYMFASLWVIRLRQCGCGVKFMVVMIRSNHGRQTCVCESADEDLCVPTSTENTRVHIGSDTGGRKRPRLTRRKVKYISLVN